MTRNIFILVILFAMSFALQYFGVLGDTHNSVLLAIGLVLLAAYTLSEIGSKLKLPRVTGYILTGLLLGPYALKILSSDVVKEIEMFNTLAIGLIAVTAGLELHFSSLRKVIAPILTTSLLKVLLLTASCTASMFLAWHFIYPLPVENGLPLLALALVFSALSIGTSPAISLAVISEMKAKSRLSQIILGSAIVKDVIMVIALAIAISFAKTIMQGSGDMATSFIHLMEELGYSLLAGCLLGGLFIAYLRFIRAEMFLFIAAVILGTAEIAETLHLELLLVFIVSGIVVRNFSKDQHFLHESLEKVSLPVFVVFFTNVGAGLNLTATWEFLPVAGILFAARGLSFFVGSWLACYWHAESNSIRKTGWLGYLPQAGVTLGLIQIASKGLPEFAELITNIGIGFVTLNLLVGPIFLRIVLKNEEPQQDEDSDEDDLTQEISREELEAEISTPPHSEYEEEFQLMLQTHCEELEDTFIEKHILELSEKFYEIFRKNQVFPQKNILKNFIEELQKMEDGSEQEIVARIDEHFRKMSEKGKDIYNTMHLFQKEIDRQVVVSLRPYASSVIYIQKNDSILVRCKKIIDRPYFLIKNNPQREVPLRKLAKYNLEPFVGSFTIQVINSWYRLLGRHIETFQKSLETHDFNAENIVTEIEKENDIWLRSVQSDFFREYSRVVSLWSKQLNQINTAYLPDSRVRYSQVEPVISERFEKAKNDSIQWEDKFIFCRNRLKVIVQSALLSQSVEKLIDDKFFEPVEQAKNNADKLVNEVFDFFKDMETTLRESESYDKSTYEKLFEETKTFAEENLQAELKTKYVRGSFRLLNRDISMNLKRSLPKEEGNFQIASETTPAHQVSGPEEIIVKKINLHELFEQSILINFLPVIEERIEGVSNYLESLLLEMEQAFSILNYSLETQLGGETELSPKELSDSLLSSISSEKDKISELHQGLTDYVNSTSESTEKLLDECQVQVKQGIERFSVVNTAKTQFRQRLFTTVQYVRDFRNYINGKFEFLKSKLKKVSLQQFERDIDRTLSKKIISKTLDTTTIRQFIQETYSLDRGMKNLPRVYFRLFSLDPIQDKRFFIAHKSKWQHFVNFSQEDGFNESQKILVIGDRGIGKSSLINVVQMEIETNRLIRIEGEELSQPLKALARALSCKATSSSLLAALRKNPATVVIDNIDQMINRKDLSQLENLFDVIKQSPHETHWILSITMFNLEVLDRAYKIRSLFNKLVDLNEVNLETCKEIIMGRHRLSGLEINYPKTFISDFALKVGLSTEDEMFFRVLYERSHGQLRHLIYLWLLSLSASDGKSIDLSMASTVERGLPMIHEFSFLQKYILNELYCYHSQSLRNLSLNLGVSYSILDNETQYLEHCGLIQTRGIDRSVFEIPGSLVTPVGHELKKEGILNEGFNKLR